MKRSAFLLWVVLGISAAFWGHIVSLTFKGGFRSIAVGDFPNEDGSVSWIHGRSVYVPDAVARRASNTPGPASTPMGATQAYRPLGELPDRLTREVPVYPDPCESIRRRTVTYYDGYRIVTVPVPLNAEEGPPR